MLLSGCRAVEEVCIPQCQVVPFERSLLANLSWRQSLNVCLEVWKAVIIGTDVNLLRSLKHVVPMLEHYVCCQEVAFSMKIWCLCSCIFQEMNAE